VIPNRIPQRNASKTLPRKSTKKGLKNTEKEKWDPQANHKGTREWTPNLPLYKEPSNIPSSFPLDICNRALASLWNGRERGKQVANELGFQELAAIHLLTSLYEGHRNTKILLLHKTRPQRAPWETFVESPSDGCKLTASPLSLYASLAIMSRVLYCRCFRPATY
jgi:hypothetical protein